MTKEVSVDEMGLDADKWAKTFMEVVENDLHNGKDSIDWDMMHGWFANCIEHTRAVVLYEGHNS